VGVEAGAGAGDSNSNSNSSLKTLLRIASKLKGG
jgi:hypothetical protein